MKIGSNSIGKRELICGGLVVFIVIGVATLIVKSDQITEAYILSQWGEIEQETVLKKHLIESHQTGSGRGAVYMVHVYSIKLEDNPKLIVAGSTWHSLTEGDTVKILRYRDSSGHVLCHIFDPPKEAGFKNYLFSEVGTLSLTFMGVGLVAITMLTVLIYILYFMATLVSEPSRGLQKVDKPEEKPDFNKVLKGPLALLIQLRKISPFIIGTLLSLILARMFWMNIRDIYSSGRSVMGLYFFITYVSLIALPAIIIFLKRRFERTDSVLIEIWKTGTNLIVYSGIILVLWGVMFQTSEDEFENLKIVNVFVSAIKGLFE